MIILNIKELRKEKGLSVRQLAKLAQISKTHLNDIENSKGNPTMRTLYVLSKALNVPFEATYTIIDD